MMRSSAKSKYWLIFLLLATAPALGQDDTRQSGARGARSSPEDRPQPTVQPDAQQTQHSRAQLEEAYRKEYAFLEAQQRDLREQLDKLQSDYQGEKQSLEDDIERLERQVLQLSHRAEELQELAAEAERTAQRNAQAREILGTTFSQAGSTLSRHRRDLVSSETFTVAPDEQKVRMLFQEAQDLVTDLSQLRSESGSFFLPDGTQVEGTIIRVGNVASFGVSDRGAGVLAPAGEGEFKIWRESDGSDARTLAEGGNPDPLNVFLYESTSAAVSEQDGRGPIAYINNGGAIAWAIVGLGLLAGMLIITRALFLRRASASTGRLEDEVGAWVKQGRIQDALEACQRENGATARVMAAAVRNLERDREHVEDIVSEAILHENAHLNRFGAFILVIAAVSPLLGLLGTVTGMISTFDVITEFGTGDPKLLSGGISIALITTELGLMVAIPTLLLGNLLSGWAERIKTRMEQAALRVINRYQEARYEEQREAA